jgi:dTDP-L-rhamnose 4-epimerase
MSLELGRRVELDPNDDAGMSSEKTCVVTGGAGFIGCALSSGLVRRFRRVIVLDILHPQIHRNSVRPDALRDAVDFRRVDVTRPDVWDEILAEARPEVIVHLAAETGTGQSLTEASRHAGLNVYGTAIMLDSLSRHDHVPGHILLTSSRAVYGEGGWQRDDGTVFYPGQRNRDQLAQGAWDFPGARPLPFAAERTIPHPTSIYGATKLAQEHILEAWSSAFGTALTIARLQNVYGPGQSLINSYTGIVSLFARLAREGTSIPLYEDGLMQRDFVYIDDVADALLRAVDRPSSGTIRIDIGSGETTTVRQVASFMARRYSAPAPHVSGAYRHGDVRHASSDACATLRQLGWAPRWSLEKGLDALCAWIDARHEPDSPAKALTAPEISDGSVGASARPGPRDEN